MTSPLGSEEIEFFRSFKKTAIVLMLLLRLDRPVGEGEIAGLLDISPKTVRSYLRSLADCCLVARARRYHGWTLTAGGRRLVLGEARPPLLAQNVPLEQAQGAGGMRADLGDANSRSGGKNGLSSEAKGGSQSTSAAGCAASVKNSLSRAEIPPSSGKNCRSNGVNSGSQSLSAAECGTTGKNSPSSGKNCRSRPVAAASLSLSFKEEKNKAAAATGDTSVENYRSSGKISRSLAGRQAYKVRNGGEAAGEMAPFDARLQENLQAFASIGVMKNKHVLEICKMKHVNPHYILGQKKRLEAERRYAPGLLLTVIHSNDYLPAEYRPCKDRESDADICEPEAEVEEEPEPVPKIEPDASIHEPVCENGMTAMRAWSAVLGQLEADMPKATFDQWVRDLMLLSAQKGTFVIGTPGDYAREWLESRLTSTIVRLLAGICNRRVEVRFINCNDLKGNLN